MEIEALLVEIGAALMLRGDAGRRGAFRSRTVVSLRDGSCTFCAADRFFALDPLKLFRPCLEARADSTSGSLSRRVIGEAVRQFLLLRDAAELARQTVDLAMWRSTTT